MRIALSDSIEFYEFACVKASSIGSKVDEYTQTFDNFFLKQTLMLIAFCGKFVKQQHKLSLKQFYHFVKVCTLFKRLNL